MAEPKPVPAWMRPIGVRATFCIAPALWACFEAWNGDVPWAMLFLGLSLYGVWSLILQYKPPEAS